MGQYEAQLFVRPFKFSLNLVGLIAASTLLPFFIHLT